VVQMTQTITSLQNPLIKEVRLLLEKNRERRKRGLFVAEGRREVSLALSADYKPKALLICPEIFREDPAYPIKFNEFGSGKVFHISAGVYNKLAYRKNVEGVLLTGVEHEHTLQALKTGKNPLVMVVEKVEKPGNLGAILRTCDAAGVDAVIVCDPATDLYNPNTIRSSLGCLFTSSIATGTVAEVRLWLNENGITAYAASPDAIEPYYMQDFTGPAALIFGSESEGLSPAMMQATEKHVIIPMAGKIDSLNVSASVAIMLFEAVRQRRMRAEAL
jgi:RNA methyltransferase, TrmH family